MQDSINKNYVASHLCLQPEVHSMFSHFITGDGKTKNWQKVIGMFTSVGYQYSLVLRQCLLTK